MAETPNNPEWLKYFKNFYIITGLLFFIWIAFFDNDNLIKRRNQKNKEQELKNQEEYYGKEILDLERKMKELKSNNQTLEKFAREKYFMHRTGEDVYVIKELDED
ncbi:MULTISPECIES: FtsB family cell division protein [Flammeovirga]|uniref:Septum formation initiator family protein n=1 Tax=Flammeovirga agarivorans TaxID=2726742 RepID=A0A7X8SJC2_9BACT|nr:MULTISPECIES: septum formation initiator family protein [Flammeovirga]NLR91286.1 septum formation initiator family protein [Flammeovirga agarivorans]